MTAIASFDGQAADFDRRAGLPARCSALVADRLVEITGLASGVGRDRGRLLEIGAGTGQIGAQLLAAGIDYLGLDRSRPMLEVFARRLAPQQHARLIVADANERWPVPARSLAAVFLSRVVHLLDPVVVWSESRRVAGPGGCWLIIGRRGRERDSVRAGMRRQMHALLADEGVGSRSGGEPHRMLRAMESWGGQSRFATEVARWAVVHRPRQALEAWRGKPGLAGVQVDDALKARVLDRLEAWTCERYGPLDREHRSEEHYALHGLRVPGGA
ncbi:MAG: class I SAM-dependent methyltransferase [Myxococcota bacterium]